MDGIYEKVGVAAAEVAAAVVAAVAIIVNYWSWRTSYGKILREREGGREEGREGGRSDKVYNERRLIQLLHRL